MQAIHWVCLNYTEIFRVILMVSWGHPYNQMTGSLKNELNAIWCDEIRDQFYVISKQIIHFKI